MARNRVVNHKVAQALVPVVSYCKAIAQVYRREQANRA